MALSVATLASSWRFAEAIAVMAAQFGDQFDETPRLARALVSHQRWMMTQAAFALYADHLAGRSSGPGMTASGLVDWICQTEIASRNTVLTYVDQLLSYRFIRLHPASAKRPRSFEASEASIDAMQRWLGVNLAVLDHVDGGERLQHFRQRPELLFLVQPEFARLCLDDRQWREPGERIGLFLWTESGALVMDRFISLTPNAVLEDDFYDLGTIDIPAMAERFVMSRTHLQRALRKAEQHGCIRRNGSGRASHIWLAADFYQEYRDWLARKSAILDAVFEKEVMLAAGVEQAHPQNESIAAPRSVSSRGC
ncbi:hypothetical protein ACQY1H_21125 [Agrobacterium vitis]|uniref:hypothetical protein n=1 Tax=Agrobacterium vitis TaxID=373 RepID=UPI003D2A3423